MRIGAARFVSMLFFILSAWCSKSFRGLLFFLCLSTVGVQAQSMSVSPSVSGNGSYTLSYTLPTISPPASPTFKLYEKIGSGNWTQIAFLSMSSTSYSFSGKSPGTYSYRISLTVCQTGYPTANPCSTSENFAGPVTVTVASAPSMPGGISPTLYHLEQKIIISWLASTGQVSRYELQNNGTTIYSGTALTRTLTGVSIGASQTFRVRACNSVDLRSEERRVGKDVR